MYTDESATIIFPAGMEPAAVIQAFDTAANAGELERVMAFFSADAVVRLMYPAPFPEPDTYSGQAEIRRMLERFLAGKVHIQSSDYKVAGDQMTWRYRLTSGRLEQLGAGEVEGGAGATFAHGKVLHLTLSFSPNSTERIVAALDRAGIQGPISEGLTGREEITAGALPAHGPRPHLGPTWRGVGMAQDGQVPLTAR